MCVHNCGAKLYWKKGGKAPPPSHMHKILIIMIYYIRSLAVPSAMLSYVLISTVSCSPLCHALACTRTYSPLWSTLPCSHMYSYIQSIRLKQTHNSPLRSTLPYFHLYIWPAEYLRNPRVAWLVSGTTSNNNNFCNINKTAVLSNSTWPVIHVIQQNLTWMIKKKDLWGCRLNGRPSISVVTFIEMIFWPSQKFYWVMHNFLTACIVLEYN